jgi:hypothetical protein
VTGEFEEQNYSFVETTSKHALDLMEQDAAAASAWINQLPEGKLRLQTKKNLALNWRNYDPEGAQQWLSFQPVADRSAIEAFLASL